MAHSQNGWPVVERDRITDPVVLGTEFPNGWLKGDVNVIFLDLIHKLNAIEPIDKGGCWGYFVKKIEGSTSISNHASGTAIDYNAPAHPMGSHNTYSAAKRTAIRNLLKRYEGVIRWGGDYKERPDDMHFEIVGSVASTKRVANKILKESDVPRTITDDDVDAFWVKNINPNEGKSNLAYTSLYSILGTVNVLKDEVAELRSVNSEILALIKAGQSPTVK